MSSFKISRVVPQESELHTPNHPEAQKHQDDVEDDESYQESDGDITNRIKFCGSIKFWLIFLISLIVFMSIFLLMAISLSSFVPSIVEMSNSLRTAEFKEIISFTTQIFKEVSIASDSITYQMRKTLDFSNLDQTELLTYQGFKTEWKYHQGLIVTSYVGDNKGTCYGIINWGGAPTLLNITTTDQRLYTCHDFDNLDYCNRSSTPDTVLGFFDLSNLVATCDSSPGSQVFSLSYIDSSMPQFTFISLLNCLKPSGPVSGGHKFEHYFGFDLSVETISKFLSTKTKEISGSKSFIIEIETSFLVAIDDPTVSLADIEKDKIERKHYLQLNTPRYNSITTEMVQRGMKNLKTIIPKCNSLALFDFESDYVSMYRLCTESKLDWMIVLAVPKWNYVGSIIISLIASIAGALLIMVVGLITSIFVSVRIVKPFYNLIELFESVAHMDLDELEIKQSAFTEVKQLQGQFTQMVGRIKLYRAFIPAHLLSQLEHRNENSLETDDKQKSVPALKTDKSGRGLNDRGSSGHFSFSKSDHSGSYVSHSHNASSNMRHQSSRRKKYSQNVDMFSLHLIKKKITILCCHLEGLSELLKMADTTIGSDIIVKMLSDVFDHVNALCRTSGGHVGAFENDCISISYNSSTNQEKHQEKAAQGCVFLLEKLNTTKHGKWPSVFGSTAQSKEILDLLHFKFAILYNEVCCGNIGTNEMKNFAIISSATRNFEIMLETTKRLGLSIVITERLQKAIKTSFNTRLVDEKSLLHEEVYSTQMIGNTANHEYEEMRIYELGENIATNMQDEWMYELQDKERKERWNVYNHASSYYIQGEYETAIDKYRQFQIKNENDKAVKEMIERCEKFANSK